MRTILAVLMTVALLCVGGITGTSHASQGQIVADDSGGNGAGA
jgi:hypothetical protein